MKYQRILFIVLMYLAIYPLRLFAQSESITITPRASNNYVIPPGTDHNTIYFDVGFPGSYPAMKYRYHQYVDYSEVYGSPVTFPSQPYSGSFSFPLQYGWHSISVSLDKSNDGSNWTQVSSNSTSVTLSQNHRIIVQNSFDGSGLHEGFVTIDFSHVQSGTENIWSKNSNHSIFASDEGTTHNGYSQGFLNWSGFGSPEENVWPYFDVIGDATYTANFDRVVYAYFQNNFDGVGSGGVIDVRNQQYTSPTYALSCIRSKSIVAQAFNQPFGGLEYAFSDWSPGGSQSASTAFYPQGTVTYTANFVFSKPQQPLNLQASGSVGQHVQLQWSANPHANVSFEIYRERKNESSQLAGTVGSGGTSWTDVDVVITGTGDDELLQYHVFSSYSGVLSDPSSAVICAKYFPTSTEKDIAKMDEDVALPTSYRVGNYPNPFNPSTTISYHLAKAASVNLEVYDMMGRKIRTLIDGSKSAGYFSVVWNSKDESGRDVSSGVYLYRFTATPTNGEKPFQQSGKLMLMK